MAAETCTTCGLPDELCVCEDVAKSDQTVTVTTEERRFGKVVTLVSGFDASVDLEDLASDLKSAHACGGTVNDDGSIELQGDHLDRIGETLRERGFTVDRA